MSDINLASWQRNCLANIMDKNCVILSSPTGSGKTACYEEWALSKKERPIFITAPIKALSNQRYRDLSAKGYKVALETGDVSFFPNDDCDIICCTQEIYNYKYRALENTTVIIDEFSYIYDDAERARAYIDALIYSNATNIMLCSATYGNPTEVLDYIKRVSGRDFYLFENSQRLTELEYKGAIPMSRIHDSFVVAYSKEDCYILAKKLYEQRLNALKSLKTKYDPRNRYKGKIKELANKYEIKNAELIELALMGVVYYCGKLLPKEKIFVEELLEHRYVDSVVGTNALALGVNFPIESVVFSALRHGTTQKNLGGSGKTISKGLFEQLSGRAGRKKYFDKGYVYYCNDFYNLSLENSFWELVRRPTENFRVVLNSDIKSILAGDLTVEEDSYLRVKYSTVPLDFEKITARTQHLIDFIKNLDITQFYFDKVYKIDISNGFYQAIDGFSPKRQKELETISEQLANAQSLFEKDISRAYISEFSIERNCNTFIDVLIGTPLERIIRRTSFIPKTGEYDIKALLDLRKYMNKLPVEYSENYDLKEIDNLIISIDPTVLSPHRYASTIKTSNTSEITTPKTETKEEKKQVSTKAFPKELDIIKYKNKKYVKMMVEDEQILLCDYANEGPLKLNYIPLRSLYMIVGYIGKDKLLEMWPRIDFSSFGELGGNTSSNIDASKYECLLTTETPKESPHSNNHQFVKKRKPLKGNKKRR